MLEEKGRVVRVGSGIVWIEMIKQSACSSCSAQKGCGQSLIAKIGDGKRLEIQVDNPNQIDVTVNDQVTLGVGERSFLTASLLVYMLPLLAMFIVSVTVQLAGFSEPKVILSAILGLAGGFLLTRFISGLISQNCSYRPVLLRRV
ncbi:SoxR reducing system RseC family protein [Amphritea sp. 2_MG-2023]|jgi:sigma-E factor negative regulatory protein RseC|uniref:SoxR reducing system RseC family protein n=1 Tax=Amphritea TaxID=515417 RepID=UPI001C065EC3|nr:MULTISPECIES: SoxR reducing system RseC family protein [Amphritea]MBU2964331.1 SoxR reducing system RseC family protein [Amphritea atlantica]MDO6420548.1 SoxR reducing system RseC family protein [Amphritea sp. 2_MG-2023]MDX2423362.1 SoxR reducing system RseC family protein [Amphritea sp.]